MMQRVKCGSDPLKTVTVRKEQRNTDIFRFIRLLFNYLIVTVNVLFSLLEYFFLTKKTEMITLVITD